MSPETKIDSMAVEKLEAFVNDHLREDLREYEKYLSVYNTEITEFIQLKSTLETIQTHLPDGFKTQMNIGGNFFMQAKVPSTKSVLVHVGKDIFVDFTLDEAIKFSDFKIRVLTKEADCIREASIKKRADIKLALMCIAEKQKLHLDYENRD